MVRRQRSAHRCRPAGRLHSLVRPDRRDRGIQHLADANAQTNKEKLETLLRDWYLTTETAIIYYDVIETNNEGAASRLYPEFLERGFRYVGIKAKHRTTLEAIRERAQLLYIQETGEPGA